MQSRARWEAIGRAARYDRRRPATDVRRRGEATRRTRRVPEGSRLPGQDHAFDIVEAAIGESRYLGPLLVRGPDDQARPRRRLCLPGRRLDRLAATGDDDGRDAVGQDRSARSPRTGNRRRRVDQPRDGGDIAEINDDAVLAVAA